MRSSSIEFHLSYCAGECQDANVGNGDLPHYLSYVHYPGRLILETSFMKVVYNLLEDLALFSSTWNNSLINKMSMTMIHRHNTSCML